MSTRRLQILLVEDNPGDADLLREGLEMLAVPADIADVSRMTEAEDYLKHESSVDVVLLDLGLPETQGLETLERARRIAPHLPIIVLSGLEDEPTALEAVRKGAQDYQVKGQVQPRVLWRAIHHAVERKRLEEALRKSEQEFRSLAEAVPQIVWATRPDGWNIYFNQQWMDYTGLTLDESYGHGWNTPFHPDDKQRAWDAWQRATQHNEPYLLECRLRRADGVYRWWLIHGAPMRSANGEIQKWFGTCTDIEELKQAEEALQQAKTAAEAATEAKSQFLANMSHELPHADECHSGHDRRGTAEGDRPDRPGLPANRAGIG